MGEKADNKVLLNKFLFNKVIGIWLRFVVKMGYFSINIDGRRAVVRGFYKMGVADDFDWACYYVFNQLTLKFTKNH